MRIQDVYKRQVYRKVCIELLRELFDTLPKKDRDILGKTGDVFGYPEATLKEIGMYHMMKESAVEQAKNRAVEKLRESYPGSRLQVWRTVHRMIDVYKRQFSTLGCPSKNSATFKAFLECHPKGENCL